MTTTSPIPESAGVEGPEHRRIVVGVDGSEASREALRWALGQARLTGASLAAIMAWQIPAYAYASAAPLPAGFDLEGSTLEAVKDVVTDVLGRVDDVGVTTTAVEGDAAHALLDAGKDAELIIIGSRGHGAFAGLVLGSVSERVASHASCPVVIVHARHR